MRLRTLLRLALVLLTLLAAAPASAQDSGGSFGGGDFGGDDGGGGGGGSDDSYDSGGSSYDSGDSSTYTYGGGGGGGASPGCLIVLFIGLVLFLIVFAIYRSESDSRVVPWQGAALVAAATGGMQASAIALGIDWRGRREVQARLAELAAQGKAGTAEGRAELLREAVLALVRAQMSWLYAGYREERGLDPRRAEEWYRSAGTEARSRFRREVVRDAQGTVRKEEAPATQARSEEGEGVVVVTLIVVSRRGVRGIATLGAAADIKAALDDRAALTARDLVAIEVVWSPAAENDRMSTAEMEPLYPDLKLIDPASIAGRVFCTFCSGPFPMELLSCPHCGAPAAKGPSGGAPAAGS